MCGIVGVCNLNGGPVQEGLLRAMTGIIAHRGPDGEGHFSDGPTALGHRRLAVLDLSEAGHQPMADESRDLVITYNGEIYNYRELRGELQELGYRFRSQTDTEVVLEAYAEWGEECVDRFNGMFAFAIYDRRSNRAASKGKLFLARDRYGIKPLYYYHGKDLLVFASEIKALLKHPAVKAQICYPALSEYFTFQNIFTDLTLFEGVHLLQSGCTLTVDPLARQHVVQRRYWDYDFTGDGLGLSKDEYADEVLRLFDQAVTRQLVADVPVGSYLSGGMDSGSITAVASRHIPRIHTFTCGFDLSSASGMELSFDERPASEQMANLFKTEHYENVLHAGDMEHVLPNLIWHLEDLRVGQCYPNYYVARLASKFVKVVLSGGGGDELFGGYPWRYYSALPAGKGDEYYQAYYDYWQRLIPDDDRPDFFNERTYAEVREHRPFDAFRSVFAGNERPLETSDDMVHASLYFEIKTFLHGLFLVEDKLSMAHSLETRVPFMDNDLVDLAQRIPAQYKLREMTGGSRVDENEPGRKVERFYQDTGDGKLVLRDALAALLPSEVTTRAKQGFSAPDASWFRGESIDYVNRLLRSPDAGIYEFLNGSYVNRVLDEHTDGRVNHRLLIWSLLSFEWWCRKFL